MIIYVYLSIVLALLLLGAAGALVATTWWLRRARRRERERHARWMSSTAEVLKALMDLLRHGPRGTPWGGAFCELCLREFAATGAMIYIPKNRGPGTSPVTMQVQARSGTCTTWQLGSPGDTIPLEHGVPDDFFWSRRPLLYNQDGIKEWMPPWIAHDIRHALLAPVHTIEGESFILLIRERDEARPFSSEDQLRFLHAVNLAEAGFALLRADAEKKQLEKALSTAHEEGMLQISTGIIHNIGNAITVIQLALERLRSGELVSCGELAGFLGLEMMPMLEARVEDGTILAFLRDEPQGQVYLDSLRTVVTQMQRTLKQHHTDLDFIVEKFRSVTEIISLQQQFIGELGTENVVGLTRVLDDVVKMCQPPIEQRGIELMQDFKTTGQILADPAMLRHILVLLIKYSIESVTASRKVKPRISLTSSAATENQQHWLRITLRDNGIGYNVDLDQELPEGGARSATEEKLRNLLFCRRRVEKYGGRFTLSSDLVTGTKVVLEFPEYAAAAPPPAETPPASAADQDGREHGTVS